LASDLVRRKLTRVFDGLDVDGSKVLERRDFELLAKRYAEYNDWPEDSEQSQSMEAFLMMWWDMLEAHCDANGDGRLTPDEFIEAFDARDDDAIDGGAAVIFDAFDTDRSGTISVEEYRRFLLIYGMDASQADEDFARLDSDADGALTREEFSEIMLQYFRSEDPDERGNFLFAEH
jgi:Ca2+-binding EF-hand superfamily protein